MICPDLAELLMIGVFVSSVTIVAAMIASWIICQCDDQSG